MEIQSSEAGWLLAEIDPLIAQLLRALPETATVNDDAAQGRIFSSPTAGADAETDSDWRENVVPEMREVFQSHLDIVAADLAGMQEENETFSFSIPAQNGRAWVHTLNQARLALGARHDVTEDDTSGRRRRRTNAKTYALMQIDFYGMILSLLLGQTEL